MNPDRFFSVFRTASRGMEAQRRVMSAASENLANVETTRGPEEEPYRPKRAVHEAPRQRYGNFVNLLDRMQTRIRQKDARHAAGGSLDRMLDNDDLGPRTEVVEEERFRTEYDPSHPDAGPDGYVRYPDINPVKEMARMVSANRLYEANLSTVSAAKEMIKRTLQI